MKRREMLENLISKEKEFLSEITLIWTFIQEKLNSEKFNFNQAQRKNFESLLSSMIQNLKSLRSFYHSKLLQPLTDRKSFLGLFFIFYVFYFLFFIFYLYFLFFMFFIFYFLFFIFHFLFFLFFIIFQQKNFQTCSVLSYNKLLKSTKVNKINF